MHALLEPCSPVALSFRPCQCKPAFTQLPSCVIQGSELQLEGSDQQPALRLCGKLEVLDRILRRLLDLKHKVHSCEWLHLAWPVSGCVTSQGFLRH